MLKNITWKAVVNAQITFVRYRQCKPLCPYPLDFSKVDKLTICGASNPLGQYLAFLLKRAEILREIAIYDDCNVRGIALDLEHMNTRTKIRPNSGEYAMKNALRRSDIIVITEGYEAALDENEDRRIRENAALIYKYGVKIASTCPEALVCIITPPINVMVPLFSEVMKVCNAYDPTKIFGVPALAEMRANSIVAEYLGIDPACVKVPIFGGVTPSSYVPLLSHATPYKEFSDSEICKLTNAILEVPDHCRKLFTAAPLSSAYALARFILTLAAGLCTCCCAKQTAFVRSDVFTQVEYFSSTVSIGTQGATANYGIPKIHDVELNLLSQALTVLEADHQKACCLFGELHRDARRDEIEEICQPRKPFITKTPCPPDPPCIPRDVCPPKKKDPCAPIEQHVSRCSCVCPD